MAPRCWRAADAAQPHVLPHAPTPRASAVGCWPCLASSVRANRMIGATMGKVHAARVARRETARGSTGSPLLPRDSSRSILDVATRRRSSPAIQQRRSKPSRALIRLLDALPNCPMLAGWTLLRASSAFARAGARLGRSSTSRGCGSVPSRPAYTGAAKTARRSARPKGKDHRRRIGG